MSAVLSNNLGETQSHTWSTWATGTRARSTQFRVPYFRLQFRSFSPCFPPYAKLERIVSRMPSIKLAYGFSACHGLQETLELLRGFVLVVVHVIRRGSRYPMRLEALRTGGPLHVNMLHTKKIQRGRDPRSPRRSRGHRLGYVRASLALAPAGYNIFRFAKMY